MSEIIIYQAADGVTKIETKLEGETVWLTNLQLSRLFGVTKSTISEHIKNIFDEGELEYDSTVRKFRTVATNNKVYDMEHYNLDVIISLERPELADSGKISRDQAITKAKREYHKYQTKTISAAESDYLKSLKKIEKRVAPKIIGGKK
jgi:hypothetical protein